MTAGIVIKFVLSFCGLQFWELWFYISEYIQCFLYAVYCTFHFCFRFLGQHGQRCPI